MWTCEWRDRLETCEAEQLQRQKREQETGKSGGRDVKLVTEGDMTLDRKEIESHESGKL